jgi:hypothetical protein
MPKSCDLMQAAAVQEPSGAAHGDGPRRHAFFDTPVFHGTEHDLQSFGALEASHPDTPSKGVQ